MSDKLLLFEFFHKLKNFTTASYSAKKLQDILEKELDNDQFDVWMSRQWVEKWGEIHRQVVESIEEIDKITERIIAEDNKK